MNQTYFDTSQQTWMSQRDNSICFRSERRSVKTGAAGEAVAVLHLRTLLRGWSLWPIRLGEALPWFSLFLSSSLFLSGQLQWAWCSVPQSTVFQQVVTPLRSAKRQWEGFKLSRINFKLFTCQHLNSARALKRADGLDCGSCIVTVSQYRPGI